MFISVSNLHKNRGVDQEIARFFVDRKVPAGNAFWEKRLLYITRGNGYLSIPVYYDLLYRIGVAKELLLDELHVRLMEQVMHYAIVVEYGQMSFEVQLENIKRLLSGRARNPDFYLRLTEYLGQPVLTPIADLGREVPALNRADVFLFILCDLPLNKSQTMRAVRYWYALHTTYLLMDDFMDYHLDEKNKEENAIIELGGGSEGSKKAFEILHSNVELLLEINPVLGQFFEESLDGLKQINL